MGYSITKWTPQAVPNHLFYNIESPSGLHEIITDLSPIISLSISNSHQFSFQSPTTLNPIIYTGLHPIHWLECTKSPSVLIKITIWTALNHHRSVTAPNHQPLFFQSPTVLLPIITGWLRVLAESKEWLIKLILARHTCINRIGQGLVSSVII